ncbi:MAG: SRPBCC family protein [Aurantibacter sp.]
MKYTTEIVVDVPRKVFIEKMDNPENMKHWQQGLVGYKLLSDPADEEGAKMELNYKMGKREITMVETIIKLNFPHEFHATYDAKNVHNIQKNYFKDVDGRSTRWISEAEFQFSGFMMKAMGFLMPGAFKKQSLKYMQDFKAFAEDGTSVMEV